MPTATLTHETHQPATVDELIEIVRGAHATSSALYPVGGGTSLDYGLPIIRPGANVVLTEMNRVVDYPAADMTVTVGAGMTMAELDRVLSAHRQQLPLDVPRAGEATLGGVLATNFSGPRRLGYGTARDYVIGIRAVDGRGNAFAGGGRVVKNVAGYDFCKLLIGSLGTLGIITEVTLKLKPRAACRQALVAAPADRQQLQRLLTQLVHSRAQPVAVEWLMGPAWHALAQRQGWPATRDDVGWLLLLLEGMDEEVAWMARQLQVEWRQLGQDDAMLANAEQTEACLSELTEWPAGDAALVLKANVRPSQTVGLVETVIGEQPGVSVQAHAGSGIVIFRLAEFPTGGLARTVTASWQPAAAAAGGNLVILTNRSGQEMTRRSVWGNPSAPLQVMQRIKAAFDPHNILNPERFVY